MSDDQSLSTTEETYITRQEAAAFLGLTPRGLDYHVRKGVLSRIKSGKRVYFSRRDVERFKMVKEGEAAVQTTRAIVGELQRQNEMRFEEINNRFMFLEHVMGVSGRASGLNKPVLLAMAEEAVRKTRQVDRMPEEEKDTWLSRIAALDYKTTKYCLNTPDLSQLPLWLLRLGMKIASSRETKKQQNEDLLHCRNLRLLLQSFQPPKPLYYGDFRLSEGISPLDALILASHAY